MRWDLRHQKQCDRLPRAQNPSNCDPRLIFSTMLLQMQPLAKIALGTPLLLAETFLCEFVTCENIPLLFAKRDRGLRKSMAL